MESRPSSVESESLRFRFPAPAPGLHHLPRLASKKADDSRFAFDVSRYNLHVPKRNVIPVALTIAGSDSGGGAGLQADIKTFASLGVHGTAAITSITAQNPSTISAIQPCTPEIVRRQIEAVFSGFRPGASKTGMLYSAEIIRTVAQFFRRNPSTLVIDPVMISTSGVTLLKASARKVLIEELLPTASLVMPNLPEAEILLGTRIESPEDLRWAARATQKRFGCAALVKGGHLRGLKVAIDFFYDGKQELLLSAPLFRDVRPHGTGCVYSAAVTAYLARGCSLPDAVQKGKQYITKSIALSRKTNQYTVLGVPQITLPSL